MIKLYIEKVVSDWNDAEGMNGKTWCVLSESATVQKSIRETLATYGLNLDDFEDVTAETEPEGTLRRRLIFCQVEDANGNAAKGNADVKGCYLADYSVYVCTYAEIKTELVAADYAQVQP
jgi:ABC-type nitrate/sulfonate/bicarbonate transport system substrate-binding protein